MLDAEDAPVVETFNWSGFYVGGHLSAGIGSSNIAEIANAVIWPGFVFTQPPPLVPLVLIPSRFSSVPAQTVRGAVALGGVQLGANLQRGRAIFGVEADIAAAALSQSGPLNVGPDPFLAGQVITGTFTADIDWTASLRARLGFAVKPRVMLYATGGLAYGAGQFTSSFTLTPAPLPVIVPAVPGGTTTATSPFGSIGWTAGLGAEWAANDKWSVGWEYSHSAFAASNVQLASTDPSGLGLTDVLTTSVRHTVDVVTLRFNRHLGK